MPYASAAPRWTASCATANGRKATSKKMLGHLDATLAPFDPEGNPKAIKAKRPYKRVKLFGAGKLSRTVLDAPAQG